MNPGIYWLASYPKSGNTWTRAVISNYQHDGDAPININALQTDSIASNRQYFDDLLCLPSSDMTEEQIRFFQPLVYQELMRNAKRDHYIKIHDAYTFNSENKPLFPPSVSKGALYLVRNPLDVAVSYAHHSAGKVEEFVKIISNEKHYLSLNNTKLTSQLPQRLLSWSAHVQSWLDSDLNLHVVRYEDMLDDTYKTFYGMLSFLGFEMDEQRLKKALRHSSFKELQRQEEEEGFKEKAPKALSFFRQGKREGYKGVLTTTQIDMIIKHHGTMMEKFGYL